MSRLDQVIKYPASQAGPFTARNNLADFYISDFDYYNFDESYVQLNMRIDTDYVLHNKTGVHNITIQLDRKQLTAGPPATYVDRAIYNSSFIKNGYLSCAKYGQLENIREVRTLRTNLNEYLLSTSEKNDRSFKTIRTISNTSGFKYSPFSELYTVGDTLSRSLTIPVMISLKELFELGKIKEYPTPLLGQTRMHIELGLDNYNFVEDTTLPAGTEAFEDVNATDPTTLTSTQVYLKQEDIPFYTNQLLEINGTGGANQFNNVIALISSIAWNNNGTITLTFTEPLRSGATVSTGNTVSIISAASQTTPELVVETAELVLRAVQPTGVNPSQLQYRTYTTEEFNGNGATSFSRLFTIEPNCTNVYIMFPNNIVSNNPNILSYRLRNDNIDLTDRDIYVYPNKDTLYYDRLTMSLVNSSYNLQNLIEYVANPAGLVPASIYNVNSNDNNTLLVISNPLPFTPNEKQLQVNIETGNNGLASNNGIQKMVLFKEVQRVIDF